MHASLPQSRAYYGSNTLRRLAQAFSDFAARFVDADVAGASTPREVRDLPGDSCCMHRITRPGVYALTAPLFGQPGKAGIIIHADDVELRLCGTELVGTRTSHDGIVVRGHNCTIRDGAVRDWGHNGVDAMRALRCRLENVHCFRNGLYGILLGKHGEAVGCSMSDNGGPGMETDAACTIVNCAAQGNWQHGFVRGRDSVSFGLISSVNNVSRSVAAS